MYNIEILSRLQFAFTVSFHILFPAFSIGLSVFLVIIEGLWLVTNKPIYYQMCKFWIKIFALTFGMGVVSGVAMEFQLGTNWAGFAKQVGSILGPLFVYEVMTAFFIEAGSLGVMIFGWKKVGKGLHYASTVLVMLGTTLSAYWILSANTWMQHPVGYAVENGKFIVQSWHEIIFNPATLVRFLHMLCASYIAAFFVVLGVAAFYLYKKIHLEFAKINFKFAAYALAVLMPIQLYLGDASGLNVQKYQPIKTAAIEGVWNTQTAAPLILFAWPDQELQKNLFEISIPYLGSLLNTHKLDGELVGLNSVVPDDRPLVWPVFFSFRFMVIIGVIMFVLAYAALFMAITNKFGIHRISLNDNTLNNLNNHQIKLNNQSNQKNPKLLIFAFSPPLGFLAIWFGWLTAEMGRQPWVVYGLIRIKDAVSVISIYDVTISLILIVLIYGVVFGYFYIYFLDKTIRRGPIPLDQLEHNAHHLNDSHADVENIGPFEYMPPTDLNNNPDKE
jgi:cytochrome d ubiquinol oxidase subunit I